MNPYYQDDWVTIYHADAFDVLHGLSGIGGVITDPPYSSGGAFRGDRTRSTVAKYVNSDTYAYRPDFSGDNRDQHSFVVWATMWLSAARHACVPGAILCSFTDWRQLPSLSDAIQAGGWTWKNIATWWKPGIRMQRGAFSLSAEYVLFGINGPASSDFDGAVQNVYSCAPVKDKQHIAEKPDAVMRWIMSVVRPDAVILDPFMGSGSALWAAKNKQHRSIGIDVDERYCEIAANRCRQEVLL